MKVQEAVYYNDIYKTDDKYKDFKNSIENFVLDCFYYHEFDGEPINLKDM